MDENDFILVKNSDFKKKLEIFVKSALIVLIPSHPKRKAEPRVGGHVGPSCPGNQYSHWCSQEKIWHLLKFIVSQKANIPVDVLDVTVY